MKYKISVSIDEETIFKLKEYNRNNRYRFRSQSHIIEYALQKLMNSEISKSKEGEGNE